jgi:hypothetical protein
MWTIGYRRWQDSERRKCEWKSKCLRRSESLSLPYFVASQHLGLGHELTSVAYSSSAALRPVLTRRSDRAYIGSFNKSLKMMWNIVLQCALILTFFEAHSMTVSAGKEWQTAFPLAQLLLPAIVTTMSSSRCMTYTTISGLF